MIRTVGQDAAVRKCGHQATEFCANTQFELVELHSATEGLAQPPDSIVVQSERRSQLQLLLWINPQRVNA